MTVEDLCTTCKHSRVCTFSPPWREPVAECEAYAPSPPSVAQAAESGTRRSHIGASTRAEEQLGLCRSCCRRHVCAQRQPAGGTWHCADYC